MTAEALGEIIATSHYDADRRWFTIEQADPRVLIAAELLDKNMFDPAAVRITQASDDSFIGAIIELVAENGRWIYRITEYRAGMHCYVAEWPD